VWGSALTSKKLVRKAGLYRFFQMFRKSQPTTRLSPAFCRASSSGFSLFFSLLKADESRFVGWLLRSTEKRRQKSAFLTSFLLVSAEP
jgi:hypothetical protein